MQKVFKTLITVVLLFPFWSNFALSQQRINATFEASQDGKIFIYYQLNGDPEKEYDVRRCIKKNICPVF